MDVHELQLSMDPDPTAIAPIRHEIAAVGRRALPSDRAEDLELLASEVLTNAIRHGTQEPIDVRVAWNSSVTVEVRNRAPKFAPPPRGGVREGGFGFGMVGRAADRWGIEQNGGVRVWFCFDA